MPRITASLVRNLPTPIKGKQVHVRDDRVIGFAVRKTASGCTSFVFNYAVSGRDRRLTIGQFPAWSVEAARDQAAKFRRRVDAGEDPLEESRQARTTLILAQLWDRYCADVLPLKRPATQRDERSMWRRLILPKLGHRRINDIYASDIDTLHRAISISTPVQANRCLASMRHVFNKAIRWRLLAENPVCGTAKNHEEHRHRFLSDEERQRFVAALDRRPETSSSLALRFLLLTGARRGEVLKATWDQFDISGKVWIKPSSHTKQKRLHRVPLSSGALDVLHRARRLTNSDFVFPGRTGLALVEIKKLFHAVCAEAEVSNLRIHDLRHSYASLLASSGVSLPVIGGLLGHSQVATTARYSHLADKALRNATELCSEAVARATESAVDDH